MSYEKLNNAEILPNQAAVFYPSKTPEAPPGFLLTTGGGISNFHGHPAGPYYTSSNLEYGVYGSSVPFPKGVYGNFYEPGLSEDCPEPRVANGSNYELIPTDENDIIPPTKQKEEFSLDGVTIKRKKNIFIVLIGLLLLWFTLSLWNDWLFVVIESVFKVNLYSGKSLIIVAVISTIILLGFYYLTM